MVTVLKYDDRKKDPQHQLADWKQSGEFETTISFPFGGL